MPLINTLHKGFISLFLILLSGAALSEENPATSVDDGSVLEKIKRIDTMKSSQWGLRSGCINVNRIRSIDFRDDQLAIVDMRGNKQLVLMLRRECVGIAEAGFSYQVRGGQLCARFDRLIQAKSGSVCDIESIEPYVKLPESPSKK